MSYTVKYGKGLTWIKTDSSTWSPVKGAWQKNADGTWHPVTRANVKLSDNRTWESVYPTPRGMPTFTPTSLSFSPYQYHTDPDNDLDGNINANPKYITIQNTGDYDMTLSGITINNASGYSLEMVTTANVAVQLPILLTPGNSTIVGFRAKGLSTGTFGGNIQFYSNIGVFGTISNTVPLSVTVKNNYAEIGVSPNPINLTYYVLETPPTQTITVTNLGNGANLTLTGNGLTHASITGLPSTLSYSFNTFTGASGTANITAANLAVGVYSDTLAIHSNAQSNPTLNVPVTVNVLQPHGRAAFETPGVYTWQVPDHVHRLDFMSVGGGGGSAPGLDTARLGGSGGGGGSGEYKFSNGVAVTPGETLTIVVGEGGAGNAFSNAIYTPVSLSYAWSSFMNTYAVWVSSDGITPTGRYVSSRRLFVAPYTGNYTLEIQADNNLIVEVDGIQVATSSSFTTSTVQTISLSQGNRTFRFLSLNSGGPGGFAMTLKDTSNNIVWTTRTLLDPSMGAAGGATTITGSFGTITVAGGLGGTPAVESGFIYTTGNYAGDAGSGFDSGQSATGDDGEAAADGAAADGSGSSDGGGDGGGGGGGGGDGGGD